MRLTKRMPECPKCGKSRCMENDYVYYCFRTGRAYNKKAEGLGETENLGSRKKKVFVSLFSKSDSQVGKSDQKSLFCENSYELEE